MNLELYHQYAIGSTKDIKTYRLKDIETTRDLEKAVSIFEKRDTFSVKIIGVYLKADVFPENSTGKGEVREIHDSREFDVYQSLVQIGFDPRSFNRDSLRTYIGIESARMLIAPYQELSSGSDYFAEFCDFTIKRFKKMGSSMTVPKTTDYFTLLKKMLETDGLDKANYDAYIENCASRP